MAAEAISYLSYGGGMGINISKKMDAKLSIALGYISIFLQCSISVLLTPFILNTIGDSQYGVYRTIGSFVGYLTIFNFGFGDAALRYLSLFRVNNKRDKEYEFISVIFIMTLFFSVLVMVIGYGMYYHIDNIYAQSFSYEEMESAKRIFFMLIFNIVISLFNSLFQGIIGSYEKFSYIRIISILQSILKFLLIISILGSFPYAINLAMFDTLSNGFVLAGYLIFVFNNLRIKFTANLKILMYLDTGFYKEVFMYSVLIFVNLVLSQITWNVDSVIIGIKLSPVHVTVSSIGTTISSLFFNFSLVFNSVQLPQLVNMLAKSTPLHELENYFLNSVRVQSYIIFLILTGFTLYGRQFIQLWVGEGYEDSYTVALVMMIGILFTASLVSGQNLLKAMNRQCFFLLSYLISFIINCVITWLIVEKYGIIGAAASTTAAYIFSALCLAIPYIKLVTKINFYKIQGKVILNIILPVSIASITGRAILTFIDYGNWFGLMCNILIYIIVYSISLYFFAFKKEEKYKINRLYKYIKGEKEDD